MNVTRLGRAIAVLILITAVFGGLGESYLPGKFIVSGDATATAHNIAASPFLFRVAFAAYFVEAVCDIALAVLFYQLLRPVNQTLALISVALGLVSTALYAVAESFYFAPTMILSGADFMKTFTPEQIDSLVYLSLRMFGRVAGLFLALYGLATMIRGYLMYRSGYVPKTIGALFLIAGAGFVLDTAATILAPSLVTGLLLIPMGIAGIALMLWLFIKGVDRDRW